MQVTPSVRLVSKLGAGGMGAVWIADHTALNTSVVVKFMLVGLDSSASARTRFKREAEAASQVKSPHVVQTFDYGVTADGLPFIVMEHLEGRDLAAEISARGALDPVTVIAIVTQVAKALTKAHAAGLLHRDIKPDNIFLCQSESEDDLFVKLLDFGIAKSHAVEGEAELDAQTKTGQVIGTPFYMSPEQVTAQKIIDLRSDLWSLAVVAFEALTGQRPFDGPSCGALAVKIATSDAPRPSATNPALPPSVDAWFARACRALRLRARARREAAGGVRGRRIAAAHRVGQHVRLRASDRRVRHASDGGASAAGVHRDPEHSRGAHLRRRRRALAAFVRARIDGAAGRDVRRTRRAREERGRRSGRGERHRGARTAAWTVTAGEGARARPRARYHPRRARHRLESQGAQRGYGQHEQQRRERDREERVERSQ